MIHKVILDIKHVHDSNNSEYNSNTDCIIITMIMPIGIWHAIVPRVISPGHRAFSQFNYANLIVLTRSIDVE